MMSGGYAPHAYDVEGAGRLWALSNELRRQSTQMRFCPLLTKTKMRATTIFF